MVSLSKIRSCFIFSTMKVIVVVFILLMLTGCFQCQTRNLDVQAREKVLITHGAIPQIALDELKDKFELVVAKGQPNPTRGELLELIQGCVGALWYGHIRVDRQMIEAAGQNLKIVAHSGAGFDHIDVALLRSKGVEVTNAAGVLGPAVAEIAIALLLQVARRILEGNKAILEGKWLMNHPTWMVGQGISNKTVGIIGLGQNGFAVAKRIIGFEVGRVLYNDLTELKEKANAINGEFVSKELLFKESDIVFLCVPLTNLTRKMVNTEVLRSMKSNSILINTARGEVVDLDALVEALREKTIWGAGLDVMYPEPLPSTHPLTTLPNCVLTPHIGSRTTDARNTMFVLAAKNIYNALSGHPVLTPVP